MRLSEQFESALNAGDRVSAMQPFLEFWGGAKLAVTF